MHLFYKKNYKNMHNFVNCNSVVLESLLLRVLCVSSSQEIQQNLLKNLFCEALQRQLLVAVYVPTHMGFHSCLLTI